MKKYIVVVTMLVCSNVASFSQQMTSLNGYIRDSITKEALIGATIYIPSLNKGTISNNYGYYSLSVQNEETTSIQVSYIGYKVSVFNIDPLTEKEMNIYLSPGISIQSVQVTASRFQKNTETSVHTLSIAKMNFLPSLTGETDILKSSQLLPGIQSGREGTSGLYIRGGSPDQNLILLDDVPVYYVYHLGGFVSVFNEDVINKVKIWKGGFPARYSGRISSVVDLRLKDGNLSSTHGAVSVGLLSSKAYIEGPLNEKLTYIFSIRRSNIDYFTRLSTILSRQEFSFGYRFYDLNFKTTYRINQKNSVNVNFYSGSDKFFLNQSNEIDENDLSEWTLDTEAFQYRINYNYANKWGNTTGSIRWSSIINNKIHGNGTLALTKFIYSINTDFINTDKLKNIEIENYSNSFSSSIQDIIVKYDFDYYPNNSHRIRFGTKAIYHGFNPVLKQSKSLNSEVNVIESNNETFNATELSFYIEDDFKIASGLNANFGIHMSNYDFDADNYFSFQPRGILSWQPTSNLTFKSSYSKMVQYMHLLTANGNDLPSDLWMPSTENIPPIESHQFVFGTELKNLFNEELNLTVEGFYKNMVGLIEYKEGENIFSSANGWEDKVESDGKGKVYGLEFLLKQEIGNIEYWVSYTLSKNTRQFLNLNNGNEFPYIYDRRHDLSLVYLQKLNDEISVSATWVLTSGNNITFPISKYAALDQLYTRTGYRTVKYDETYPTAHIYGSRNTIKMPAYHRLDISANFSKKKSRGTRIWKLGIYNVYNRKNPYYVYMKEVEDEFKPYMLSLFPLLPSVSYEFRFE